MAPQDRAAVGPVTSASPDSITDPAHEPGPRDRTPDVDRLAELLRRIAAYPHAFDLYHAIRLIECAAPDRPRIGTSLGLSQDPVRFAQHATLAFAASSIAKTERTRGSVATRLILNGFGLLGPNGPMPLHITEYVHERQVNHRDHSPARFLDIFHHRMSSLFYRAWAVNQPTVARDRPDQDRFAAYLGSLIGIGSEILRGLDAAPDDAKLHYAGLLSSQTPHAEGLEALISDFFGVRCRLVPFVGQWLELPPESRCRLGESPESGSIGTTLVVGSRVWDVQHRFRLVLGPMSLDDFERFLPIGSSFEKLVAWVRNYCGLEHTWDVQLLLEASQVPQTRLGGADGGRLGWTTWIRSGPYPRDADQVTLRPP